MSNFAYSVAIKLSVANLASQGVRILAADLLKAHGAATNLQSKLSALKMVAVGYGVERAGEGILGFMHKAVDASKEYTHQIALMNAAGFTQKELAESIGSAWKTTGDVITSTAAGNLETIRGLRSAFGKGEGMSHAYAVLPQVQRISAIMDSLTGKHNERVGFDMVKAIELGTKGAVSVEAITRQSEMMSKALVQMGGTLSVGDFHAVMKTSRAMAPYMSDDFKYNYLPTLIQEMKTGPGGGAQGAGTAIASLGQVVVGQMIPKSLIANWVSSGLINAGSVVNDPHNRTMSKILPGGVAGQNEFGANPYLWAQKYAMPAVNRIMAEKHLDQYGAILALTHNRVAAFALQTLINKGAQFERDRKLITEGPSSFASYQTLLKRDPQMAETALHNQYQNVLARIGFDILPRLIPYMITFANGLDRIAQFMQAHPNMTTGIVTGLVGLGIGLTVVGKALMAAGIIKFLGMGPTLMKLVPLLGRTAGVFGVLAISGYVLWKNWDRIQNILTAINTAFPGLAKSLNSILWFVGKLNDLAGLMNPVGMAQNALDRGFKAANDWANGVNAVKPGGHPVQVHTQVNIDGRKVAWAVTNHQTAMANRPNNSSATYNTGRGPLMPAQ